MDLSFAEIACRQIKTKCTTFYKTAKTKVKAFYRDVEKSDVFQNFMSGCKELREEARELWRSICSRRTTKREATSAVRGKYSLLPQKNEGNVSSFATDIKTGAKQRKTEKDRLFEEMYPRQTSDSMMAFMAQTPGKKNQKSLENIQLALIEQQSKAEKYSPTELLIQKKMALVSDMVQFVVSRQKHQHFDSSMLANDLFDCQSAKDLEDRLGQGDIPKTVRKKLQAKLNKVK